ncbi:unnamed protein product [Gongylonema pulchrum]|uniref:TBD domain-containing protein n=1 Tax=Gongylonema pulchrum TaxID=637853 RepID=A0A183ESE7_9BILA|nr:unnamed protein product [Gongylonema pulchrum]
MHLPCASLTETTIADLKKKLEFVETSYSLIKNQLVGYKLLQQELDTYKKRLEACNLLVFSFPDNIPSNFLYLETTIADLKKKLEFVETSYSLIKNQLVGYKLLQQELDTYKKRLEACNLLVFSFPDNIPSNFLHLVCFKSPQITHFIID